MEINLSDKYLSKIEYQEIENLLQKQNNNIVDDLEQIWYLMDLVWNEFECDNVILDWEKIGKYYSHPVWLLNGLFIEQHKVSMDHRNAISDWIVKNKFMNVIDYGGGFGTLARLIAKKNNHIKVSVYEPHPSEYGLKRAAEYENIDIIDIIDFNYDCLLSTDVLEHVPDPLKDFSNMVDSVKVEGYLVIANAFYPMIQCHLPQNFHFRYTFNSFAKMMGLEMIGTLKGSHATIFKKISNKEINWNKIRFYENLSRISFPFMKVVKSILKLIK